MIFNFTDILSQQQYMLLQGLQDPAERREAAERIRSEHIDALKQSHRDTFPLSDNLMSLIFLVQSDLNEQQRERFVASMALRQINMNNYTYLGVKGLFLDLFCGTATGTTDPSIRRQRRSTFLVLDEGDLEEESGYWVMDQETGEEGFVSLFSESEFGVLAAKGGYTRRRIHGRRFRKPSKGGKGKGRGKGRRPVEDPALSAVEAKVQGRTMQSTLATQVSMEKARKERKVERKDSKEKMHSKAKEKASNRIPFNNPMLQPPKSLHQLNQLLMPKKPGVHMKQIGHGTRMDIILTSTILKMSGRQMKPLGNNGHTLRTDRRTDRKMKSTVAQSKGLAR